mmetsp:Transcript_6979/g.13851  ORF Transcript_6979/g.13851 Transcript_6979/m.13851 type:complete len:81 (+) Transcript_6979:127-369(+)
MSTAAGAETLTFFAKSGALALGVGYGMFRTSWLAGKERRIEQKQTVQAKKKAAIQARKSARKGNAEEPSMFETMFAEEAK